MTCKQHGVAARNKNKDGKLGLLHKSYRIYLKKHLIWYQRMILWLFWRVYCLWKLYICGFCWWGAALLLWLPLFKRRFDDRALSWCSCFCSSVNLNIFIIMFIVYRCGDVAGILPCIWICLFVAAIFVYRAILCSNSKYFLLLFFLSWIWILFVAAQSVPAGFKHLLTYNMLCKWYQRIRNEREIRFNLKIKGWEREKSVEVKGKRERKG